MVKGAIGGKEDVPEEEGDFATGALGSTGGNGRPVRGSDTAILLSTGM